METQSLEGDALGVRKVLTVPMRNGNIYCQYFSASYKSVLTVPMRNGNTPLTTSTSVRCLWFLPYLWGMETPCSTYSTGTLSPEFLPYLWGMETIMEFHKLHNFRFVLTVPMRNGNTIYGSNSAAWVIMFLPYLWGMETSYKSPSKE